MSNIQDNVTLIDKIAYFFVFATKKKLMLAKNLENTQLHIFVSLQLYKSMFPLYYFKFLTFTLPSCEVIMVEQPVLLTFAGAFDPVENLWHGLNQQFISRHCWHFISYVKFPVSRTGKTIIHCVWWITRAKFFFPPQFAQHCRLGVWRGNWQKLIKMSALASVLRDNVM